MTRDQINAACAALPHATHVIQWGGSDVWKIGGKVFAIVTGDDPGLVSFKTGPAAYDALHDAPGMRPAPYLASRGMTWVQRTGPATLDGAELSDHLRLSYDRVAEGLTKKLRRDLGL
ncbi:MAG: hypothetical protein CSA72_03755 [Rhodobacterales bacterium]|nr:MAG: hypothetical protein CSA72_03755 [Rhodobacterales bacterium]